MIPRISILSVALQDDFPKGTSHWPSLCVGPFLEEASTLGAFGRAPSLAGRRCFAKGWRRLGRRAGWLRRPDAGGVVFSVRLGILMDPGQVTPESGVSDGHVDSF